MPVALQPEVSIIIPVFNKWELTAACLKKIRETSLDHFIQVIVVDNASTDETATELLKLGETLFGDSFVRIRNEANRNFAGASNQGAQRAAANLLLFLNNDTLPTPGWLPPLFEELRRNNAPTGTGPLLLYLDDTVQHLGVCFSINGARHLYRMLPFSHPLARKKRKFTAITGAALMMPKKTFMSAGMFVEQYQNGYEDIDLCLTLAAKGGHFTCVPESVVYHLESQTPGRKKAERKNSRLFLSRWGDTIRPDAHIQAMRDGLRPFINSVGGISYDISLQESQQLSRAIDGKLLDVGAELLRANPFWLEGYSLLAAGLEQAQAYSALCQCLNIWHMWSPSTAIAIRMLHAAKLATDAPVFYARIRDFGSMMIASYEAVTRYSLKRAIAIYEGQHDYLMAQMLQKKLTELPQQSEDVAVLKSMLGKYESLQ